MDEAWLRSRIESGRSIESIAREAGKSASTVAYWVEQVRPGVANTPAVTRREEGSTVSCSRRSSAAASVDPRDRRASSGVSYTTVRHWLARHGLRTPRARRLAETAAAGRRSSGPSRRPARCTDVTVLRAPPKRRLPLPALPQRRGATAAPARSRRILVEEAGGACGLCGYDRYARSAAVPSHRARREVVRPVRRRAWRDRWSGRATRPRSACSLCANCHAEIEAGLATIAEGRTCR